MKPSAHRLSSDTLRPSLRHGSKTAYILGAGFSYPAGVPLLQDFLPYAFAALRRNDSNSPLCTALHRILLRYARIANSTQIDLDNLEDLFCLVDLPAGADEAEDGTSDDDRATLKEVIVRTVVLASQGCSDRSVVCDPHARGVEISRRYLHPAPLGVTARCRSRPSLDVTIYESFVSQLIHNNSQENREIQDQYDLDAIISLNYDLVIEEALASFEGAGVYYGDSVLSNKVMISDTWGKSILSAIDTSKPNPIIVPLLKLHGSVNWYSDSRTKPRQKSRHRISTFSDVTEVWNPRRELKKGFQGVPLVPPTWNKQATEITVFASMIEQAIRHLRRAARIVVIGYSMPEADAHFRYLLAKGLCTPQFPEIEIWDVRAPEQMQERIERMFGRHNVHKNRIMYADTGLRGFVESQEYDTLLSIT